MSTILWHHQSEYLSLSWPNSLYFVVMMSLSLLCILKIVLCYTWNYNISYIIESCGLFNLFLNLSFNPIPCPESRGCLFCISAQLPIVSLSIPNSWVIFVSSLYRFIWFLKNHRISRSTSSVFQNAKLFILSQKVCLATLMRNLTACINDLIISTATHNL